MASVIENARLRRIPLKHIGWMALVAALMTAGLVTYGSWVRVSGSGLGCPDWPLCHGGVSPGAGAAAIEFGHRVYAGFTMIAVFVATLIAYQRRSEIPRQTLLLGSATALIVIQALIGGVAVLAELPKFIIMVHLMMAMSILGLLVAGGVSILSLHHEVSALRLRPQAVIMLAAGVIMVGGSIVATQTGPGCLSLPLCEEGSTTMATWLHTVHRVLGVTLLLGTVVLAWTVMRVERSPVTRGLMAGLVLLVIGQMSAGAVAVTTTFPESLRILHVGLATLIWGLLIGLWVLSAGGRRVA